MGVGLDWLAESLRDGAPAAGAQDALADDAAWVERTVEVLADLLGTLPSFESESMVGYVRVRGGGARGALVLHVLEDSDGRLRWIEGPHVAPEPAGGLPVWKTTGRSTLAAELVGLRDREEVAGLAYAVTRGDEIVEADGFGSTDLVGGLGCNSDTVFRAGSTAKPVTAMALALLCHERGIPLDEPANAHLRAYALRQPAGAPDITIRHLLTHYAGGLAGGEVYALDRAAPSLRDHYGEALAADGPAGEQFVYDNHAYATAGQLIEDISGHPFCDWVAEHLLIPLGMVDSSYANSALARAPGYAFFGSDVHEVGPYEVITLGAGSLTTTAADMARWVMALLGHRSDVVPEEVRAEMLEPSFEPAPDIGIALGLPLDRRDGFTVTHTGGVPGATALIAAAPDRDLGLVILTNRDDRSPRTLHTAVRQISARFLRA